MLKHLIVASVTVLAVSAATPASAQDFCLNYANSIVATKVRLLSW